MLLLDLDTLAVAMAPDHVSDELARLAADLATFTGMTELEARELILERLAADLATLMGITELEDELSSSSPTPAVPRPAVMKPNTKRPRTGY